MPGGHVVGIETACELTRGMTVIDRRNVASDERNRDLWAWALESQVKARICWTLDVQGLKASLYAALVP